MGDRESKPAARFCPSPRYIGPVSGQARSVRGLRLPPVRILGNELLEELGNTHTALLGCNETALPSKFHMPHFGGDQTDSVGRSPNKTSDTMADDDQPDASSWLPVIGKSLAYLCLAKAMEREPDKYKEVLDKVKFLQGIGLSASDAAEAAGSTAHFVSVMQSRRKRVKNGKAKKKSRGRR